MPGGHAAHAADDMLTEYEPAAHNEQVLVPEQGEGQRVICGKSKMCQGARTQTK
jgi:hypothetical protein